MLHVYRAIFSNKMTQIGDICWIAAVAAASVYASGIICNTHLQGENVYSKAGFYAFVAAMSTMAASKACGY
jgi:hypothetical protein